MTYILGFYGGRTITRQRLQERFTPPLGVFEPIARAPSSIG